MIEAILAKVKAEFLAAAFSGALVALQFWPPSSRKAAFTNVAVGTTISISSVPGFLHLAAWQWPTLPVDVITGAVYFWTGLLGMQIVPIMAGIVQKFARGNQGAD